MGKLKHKNEIGVVEGRINELKYYIVIETKNKFLELGEEVKKEFGKELDDNRDDSRWVQVIDYHFTQHQIHIVVFIPPDMLVSKAINYFKWITNYVMTDQFTKLIRDTYIRSNNIWSLGYYVRSLGMEEENPLNAIRKQGLEDSKKPGSPGIKAVEAQPK